MNAKPSAPLRLATRDSPLAMTQARRVAAMVRTAAPGRSVEIVALKAHGDQSMASFTEVAGQAGVGIFTKVLDDALLERRGDFAVHSFKDYPTDIPEGLVVAAVPERARPWDVLVVRAGDVPKGSLAGPFLAAYAGRASIGTSSPRRHAQLLLADPSLPIAPVRGNVGTRLRKLHAGDFGALVMASAGLARLTPDECPELKGLTRLQLDAEAGNFLPAPAQGALGVTCRADDAGMLEILARIDDATARAAAEAERATLAALGGGCFLPLGALALPEDDGVTLFARALLTAPPRAGERPECAMAELRGPAAEPAALGRRLAELLGKAGAAKLIAAHHRAD